MPPRFSFLSTVSIVSLVLFSKPAAAEPLRWIVEDVGARLSPKTQVQGFSVLKVLNIDGRHFAVLERDHLAANGLQGGLSDEVSLKSLFGSRNVFPDFPIESIESVAEVESSADLLRTPGWHMQRLGYERLSSRHSGQGVVVAVLDSGVDYLHPELRPQIWTNKNEIPDNGIDDDGNGYIDDVYGFDFAANDPDPMDEQYHGTHVAGTIASLPDPQGYGVGAAPQAKIMPLRIMGGDRATFLSDAAEAVIYGVDNGAKILSNSWRVYKSWGPYAPTEENLALLRATIKYAASRNVLFVAAAGNEQKDVDSLDYPIYPAGFKGLANLVVVASSDWNDDLSSFSNFGASTVHIVAPGSKIYSTMPGNKWGGLSGTSMATPIVSGILARAISGGQMSGPRSFQRMLRTALRLNSLQGKSVSGLLNPVLLLNGSSP